jgi:SHS2 domain-containing protein
MTDESDDYTCAGCGGKFPEPTVEWRNGVKYVTAEEIRYDERRDGWFCDDCVDVRETAEDQADMQRKGW